jgi:hypothetical protein
MNKSIMFTTGLGTKYWKLNGDFHREDGPAIEYTDGARAWFINGQLHREDGPAIDYNDGNKQWHLNGIEYSTKEKWFQALTPEQQYNYLWCLDE